MAKLFKDAIREYIERSYQKIGSHSNRLGLSKNTLRCYRNFYNLWEHFEVTNELRIDLRCLDKVTIENFIHWMLVKKFYSANYVGLQLKLLKSICRDQQALGEKVHSYYQFQKGIQKLKNSRMIITLSLEEINRIEQTIIDDSDLLNTKKWFLLGLCIGQRVSDLLKLKESDFRMASNWGIYVDLIQQKTRKAVTIGIINKTVIDFIKNEFPKPINYVKFNRQIKKLCKRAGVDEMVEGERLNSKTNRKEKGMFPKYQLISSHCMRRSFATNYFGKIETPILMELTGHTKETTFLNYIGKNQNKDAIADVFMNRLAQLNRMD